MTQVSDTTLRRREYLATAAVAGTTLGLAGCSESGGSTLEITDRRYTYDAPSGYGTSYLTVSNSGDTTNVRGYVDLVGSAGENEGEVIESYDRTGIIEGGETEEIAVTVAHYLNTGAYERSVGVEATDRPHAAFEADEGDVVTLDAGTARSIERTITSYEWSARGFEWVGYGDPLQWGIPDGETAVAEPPDPEDYFADIVLTVTDEEGRTDEHDVSVSSRGTGD